MKKNSSFFFLLREKRKKIWQYVKKTKEERTREKQIRIRLNETALKTREWRALGSFSLLSLASCHEPFIQFFIFFSFSFLFFTTLFFFIPWSSLILFSREKKKLSLTLSHTYTRVRERERRESEKMYLRVTMQRHLRKKECLN